MPPCQAPGNVFTPLVQAVPGGRYLALGDDLTFRCLHAIRDHLLVHVESHKIGVHSFSSIERSGPSSPSSMEAEPKSPTYAFKQEEAVSAHFSTTRGKREHNGRGTEFRAARVSERFE